MCAGAITCRGCGFPLTKQELHYYGHSCEQCMRADHDRLQKWLRGAPDRYLDQAYAGYYNFRPTIN